MADSLILVIQSVIASQAAAEFQPSFKNGLTFASYAGMLIGALFWVSLGHLYIRNTSNKSRAAVQTLLEENLRSTLHSSSALYSP